MNSKDRVLAAIWGEQPDRVPIHSWVLSISRDIDDLVLSSPIQSTTVGGSPTTAESAKGDIWRDDLGRKFRCEYTSKVETWYVGGVLENPEDVSDFELPDPTLDFRYLSLKRILREEKAKERAVAGCIGGPYTRSWEARGFENFVVDMYKRPDKARKLLGMFTDYFAEMGKIMVDMGVDFVVHMDNVGGGGKGWGETLISPRLFREFILPCLQKIAKGVRSKGTPYWLDTDGNCTELLPDLAKIPIDGLSDIELQSGMSLEKTKAEIGEQTCLGGNFDIWYAIPHGTIEDVEKDVRRCIREGAPGGGYILWPGASNGRLYDTCTVEKQLAFLKTARKYGKYPLRP